MSLVDRAAREAIVNSLDETLIVEAAAGTGKTTALVGRVLALVRSGKAEIASIVAVTFTEPAAGELKLRIRTELERARIAAKEDREESARLLRGIAQLEEARVGTIHSFCADLLRRFPVEAQIDPQFEVLGDAERLYGEVFARWFERLLRDPTEAALRVLRRPVRSWDQTTAREMIYRAGRLLIDERDFDAAWVMPECDRKALLDEVVDELRAFGALAELAANPDDWFAQGVKRVAEWVNELDMRERTHGRDLDALEGELHMLTKERFWEWKGKNVAYFAPEIRRETVVARRQALRENIVKTLAQCDATLAPALREELRSLVSAYEAAKARVGALDFLDLLLVARRLIAGHEGVRERLQAEVSHVLIDEFQDTDPAQADILLMLAEDASRPVTVRSTVPGKLFIVGDPKQSIYRFRRADVRLYYRIKARLVADGARVVHLTTNFRSSPAIVAAVNATFESLMVRDTEGHQAEYVALVPARHSSRERPSLVVLPTPNPYGDQPADARWAPKMTKEAIKKSYADAVAAYVAWLVHESGWTIEARDGSQIPIAPGHICLLFKRMSSGGQDVTRDYVRALEARRIPHVLVGGRSFFLREEVGALLNALVAIEWPGDELTVYATLRGPFFALSDDTLLVARDAWKGLSPTNVPTVDEAGESAPIARALAILGTLHRSRNQRPIADTVSALLEAVRAHASVAIWPTGEQALGNLLRVLDMARRFERAGATSFRSFVDQMLRDRERGVIGDATVVEDAAEGVRMMTAHKAKGLEFPVVILADPTANATHREPSRFVDTDRKLCAVALANCVPQELRAHSADVLAADAAEALRLLYVAATRARDLLVVPGIGESHEPGLLGWVEPLSRALSPAEHERLGSKPCPGVPAFAARGVTDRPLTVRNAEGPIVSPGLHRRQSFGVVWWDTHALSLGVESDHILRQESMLVAGGSVASSSTDYAAWVERRSAALAQGSIPSRRVVTVTELSVTEFSGAAPGKVASEYVTRDDAFVAVRGRGFGTLVHEVMARVPLDADHATIAEHVQWVSGMVGVPPDEQAAAASVVERALLHPLLVRARSAIDVRREVGLAMPLPDGGIVEGVVDLAFGEASGWTVIDFKTGEASSAQRAAYEAQVELYVEAIAKAGNVSATGVLLYL